MSITVATPKIPIEAFRGSKQVTEVKFSDAVLWIGPFAFSNMMNLTKIVFLEHSNTEAIKCYAFHYCINLDDIVLPDSLLTIDEGAFMGCRKLTNVMLPGKLEFLGPDCFLGTDIKQISIPATVQSMTYAFDHNLEIIQCPSQLLKVVTKAKGSHRQPSKYQPWMVVECRATMTSLGGDKWDFVLTVPLDPKADFRPDDIAKTIVCPSMEGEVELVTENGPLREQHQAILEGKVDFSKLVLLYVHRSELV